jgi:nuclear transport factor 2 (NTF2) superfamily protein
MSPQLPSMAKCTDMEGLQHSVSPIELATATRTVRAASYNGCPQRVMPAYTADSYWRKRAEFGSDQPEMVAVLIRNCTKELRGGLIKELWAWSGAKITGRFVMRLDGSGHRLRGSFRSFHDAITRNDRN